MLLSKCVVGSITKLRFIKGQEAKQLLGAISKTINWSVINITVDKKFCSSITFMQIFSVIMDTLKKLKNQLQYQISVNKIINKVLLAGDKFMPEMHLRQPRFTYSACEKNTKI